MKSTGLAGLWERSKKDIKSLSLPPPKLVQSEAAKGLHLHVKDWWRPLMALLWRPLPVSKELYYCPNPGSTTDFEKSLQRAKLHIVTLLSTSREKQLKLNPPRKRIFHPNEGEEASSISSPWSNHWGKCKSSLWFYQNPKEKGWSKPGDADRQEMSVLETEGPPGCFLPTLHSVFKALQTAPRPTALFPSTRL